MNNIELIGRLTRDPEKTVTSKGVIIANIDLAVSRPFQRNETDYFKVIAFNEAAENWVKYLKKGSQIGVTGYMQNNRYTSKDGNKKDNWQVVANQYEFLSKLNNNEEVSEKDSSRSKSIEESATEVEDENLPF